MLRSIQINLIFIAIAAVCTNCSMDAQEELLWKRDFNISGRSLEATGRNPYFILEPGYQLVLEGSTGFLGSTDVKLMITVLALIPTTIVATGWAISPVMVRVRTQCSAQSATSSSMMTADSSR